MEMAYSSVGHAECQYHGLRIQMDWLQPDGVLGFTDENDGMDGQQPRYTARNYVHEWGHYEKQSSMWSNNKACLAHVDSNIAFNGPRAGINFNGNLIVAILPCGYV